MKKLISIYVVVNLATTAVAKIHFGAEYRAREYNFSEWRGKVKNVYKGSLMSWQLPTLQLSTNGMMIVKEMLNQNDFSALFLFTPNQDTILQIRFSLCKDIISAHEAIINQFALMSSPKLYVREDIGIGDQGFSNSNGNNWSSYIFARNNIKVSINSHITRIPAKDVARQIDADILKKSLSCEE